MTSPRPSVTPAQLTSVVGNGDHAAFNAILKAAGVGRCLLGLHDIDGFIDDAGFAALRVMRRAEARSPIQHDSREG